MGGIEPPTSCSQNRRATAAPHPESAHTKDYRFSEREVKVNIARYSLRALVIWRSSFPRKRESSPLDYLAISGARRERHPAACSYAWATRKSSGSENGRPTICKPTGRPDSVNPHGTDMAGRPASAAGLV